MPFKLPISFIGTLLLTYLAAPASAQPQQIELKPGTSIWLNAQEPAPVQKAARDLARDFQSVLGATSPLVNDWATLSQQTFVEILGPGAGSAVQKERRGDITGLEAHGVFVKRDRSGTRIVLQGADLRGTLYAIYTFSEKFLGVRPLWFWASQPPEHKKSLSLAANTDLKFGPPSVRWRTWFPNDTDLFTPWENRSSSNLDALYEAMLRLKLNCVEGAVADENSFQAPYRLGSDIEAARDRGLAFVGHHMFTLGSDINHWDLFWRQIEHREPPALTVNSIEDLKTFWRWHIELAQRNHLEEIWLIGFRGNGDRPFWTFYKGSPDEDVQRASLIERMMKTQVALVKEVTGEAAPVMRTTLYNELSDFYAAGLLRPPAEPNLIWTFVAARRDHFPAPDAQHANVPANQPIGYYMNFQFTSSGAHLAQAEGPWKMERNYRFINSIAPRPLEFAVVNMGNIREFVLEGSANAAMMWDFKSYKSDQFLNTFCQEYFGKQDGPAVAALYRDYFAAYWEQRRPTFPGFERQYIFQDLRLNQAMQRLIKALQKPEIPDGDLFGDGTLDANGRLFNIVPADNGTSNKLDALIQGTAASAEKLKAIITRADLLLPRLPAANRVFFNDNLRTQARFLLAANTATHNLALAVRDRQNGPAQNESLKLHLNQAHQSALEMRTALAEAEHGPFEGWYTPERIFGVKSRLEEISKLLEAKNS